MTDRLAPLARLAPRMIAGSMALAFAALSCGMSGAPSDGPAPIVWNEEACAECRMHVGDPRFAAQLQTRDGEVLNFDDPGCLFRYAQRRRPEIHAAWFRHHRRDRWMSQRDVRFLPGQTTPMGYGFAAVERGTAGAITYQEAARRLAQPARSGGGGHGATGGGR